MNGDRFNEHGGGRDRPRDRYREDRRDRDRDRERGGDRRERRRSRSPHGRERGGDRGSHGAGHTHGGGGGGGAGGHDENDSYSRSRDFRAREREDRYRRDERGWDRDYGDRGDRGDRRRRGGDDDDRRGGGRRGDRDLFDGGDRRGGGGGGGGGRDRGERGGAGDRGGDREGRREARRDQDEFAAQARGRKSPTPPPRNREPTPDLTDVVSILDRKRRLTQWDIKPPGYENVTAEQAKLSGMFPLPGAPRQQVVDPTRLQTLMTSSGGGAETSALKPSNSRQAKRLVASNLPPSATNDSVTAFFNLQMNGLNIIEGADPCVSCQLSDDRGFGMLEFKNPSDATLALALDGMSMEDNQANGNANANGAGSGIVIRRPKDYIVASASDEETLPTEGMVSTHVPDTANKISITNILPNLTEEQVKELLTTFGVLRSFVLVRERGNDTESRGIAFCEYVEPATTDMAIEALNGMELGTQLLKVARASIGGAQQAESLEMSVNAMSMLAGTTSDSFDEAGARVLQLLNMVTAEELMDQQDYEEIVEDVQEECDKYGRVVAVKVPRPSTGGRQSAGVGKIFVKYDSAADAKKAMSALAGRKFADRTVVVTYFSEENFDTNAW